MPRHTGDLSSHWLSPRNGYSRWPAKKYGAECLFLSENEEEETVGDILEPRDNVYCCMCESMETDQLVLRVDRWTAWPKGR